MRTRGRVDTPLFGLRRGHRKTSVVSGDGARHRRQRVRRPRLGSPPATTRRDERRGPAGAWWRNRACRYYWDAGLTAQAGLRRKCCPATPNLLVLGGSRLWRRWRLIVAAEREFVSRAAIAERIRKIVALPFDGRSLSRRGPHFLNGETGKVVPLFGKYDTVATIVETAFMNPRAAARPRQYFNGDNATRARDPRDKSRASGGKLNGTGYRKVPTATCSNWHWSPDAGFHISHPLIGWNEAMIVYLLASPRRLTPFRRNFTTPVGRHHRPPRALSSELEPNDRRRSLRQRQHLLRHQARCRSGNGSDLFFVHFSSWASIRVANGSLY